MQKVGYIYLPNGFLASINGPSLSGNALSLPTCGTALPNPGASGAGVDANDLFRLELRYDQPQSGLGINAIAQKNGNISQMTWQVRGREAQVYGFDYDYLDRLKEAEYTNADESGSGEYSTSYTYDQRGNLQTLQRSGQYFDGTCWYTGVIDQLSYAYHNTGGGTNRLKDVKDNAAAPFIDQGYAPYDTAAAGKNYLYDANGNVIYDPSKGISVSYNYLNLPSQVLFPGGEALVFTYDAAGVKLRQAGAATAGCTGVNAIPMAAGTYSCDNVNASGTVANNTTVTFIGGESVTLAAGFETGTGVSFTALVSAVPSRDYVGGIEYVSDTLEAVYHADGRVYLDSASGWRYEYTITDHLGNARLMFTDKDGDGVIEQDTVPELNEVLQENHYYPFGMVMEGPWIERGVGENRYQYNGKELVEELELGWIDYGARWYDPLISRFSTTDRFAEKYHSLTPFGYAANNPVIYIDVNGDSLQLEFIGENQAKAVTGVAEIINNALEGQFRAHLTNFSYNKKTGAISALLEIIPTEEGGGDLKKMSLHGQEFHRELTEIAHEKGTLTTVKVDWARSDVHTGSFYKETIDVADMLQFNKNLSELGGTRGGKLIHEFREQYSRQVLKETIFDTAHYFANQSENNVNLSVRRDEGEATQSYSMGGKTVRNTIIFQGRPIITVKKH